MPLQRKGGGGEDIIPLMLIPVGQEFGKAFPVDGIGISIPFEKERQKRPNDITQLDEQRAGNGVQYFFEELFHDIFKHGKDYKKTGSLGD